MTDEPHEESHDRDRAETPEITRPEPSTRRASSARPVRSRTTHGAARRRQAVGRSSRRGRRAPDAAGRRRTLAAVVALLIVTLLVGVPAIAAWRILLVPDVRVLPGNPVTVEIPPGSGTGEIARILAEAGVIENAAMFRLRARLDGIDGKLRSGRYDLTTQMPYEEVVDALLTGPPVPYVTVTVPEGLTVAQTAERFESAAGIPAAEFVELASRQAASFAADHPYLADAYGGSLEGFLFPKTYRVVEGATARDVIEMMLDQFDTEIAAVDLSYPTSRGMDLSEVVTVASIIEREARLEEERPLVSSVIYNRLDRGMRLEMCATVEYLLPGTRPRLTLEDLKIDSPYNTYLYAGLPPGPIASPGLASLQAAASPARTKYLYYVLTGEDGSHTFAETYAEFLKAKERSREVVP